VELVRRLGTHPPNLLSGYSTLNVLGVRTPPEYDSLSATSCTNRNK